MSKTKRLKHFNGKNSACEEWKKKRKKERKRERKKEQARGTESLKHRDEQCQSASPHKKLRFRESWEVSLLLFIVKGYARSGRSLSDRKWKLIWLNVIKEMLITLSLHRRILLPRRLDFSLSHPCRKEMGGLFDGRAPARTGWIQDVHLPRYISSLLPFNHLSYNFNPYFSHLSHCS